MTGTAADVSCEDFQPFLGRPCHVEAAPGFQLVLDRIETGPPAPAPHCAPFLLIFRGPKPGPVLAEGTYTTQLEGGPTRPLYLMPIHTPAPDRQEYQCVFG